MSNEVKIGILAVVAIGLSVWGFNFIKGKNLFSSSKIYKVEYKDITGLTKSAPVFLRGYQVGIVSNLYLNPENPSTVIAEIDIDDDLMIPKDTKAALASGGLMSGQIVVLEFESFCEGANCAQEGDFLKGRKVGMVESLLGVDPSTYVDQIKDDFPGMLDSINGRMADPSNDAIMATTMRDLQQTMANLNMLTRKLDVLLGASAGKFDNILTDMEALTNNLEQSNGKITQILDNAATLTGNLSKMDLNKTLSKVDGTLTKVDGTLTSADGALQQVTGTLSTADKALQDVNKLVTQLNNGEGTIGYLLTDDKLAKDVEKTLSELNKLVKNIDEKPYEYFPFKSKKKVEKYRRQDAANE